MAAGAIRTQYVDIIDGRTNDVLVQVMAGPRNLAEDVMHEVAKMTGIPFRQQLMRSGGTGTYPVMENHQRLGAPLFSNPEHTRPALHLTVLSEQEADEKEGHDAALASIKKGGLLRDQDPKYRKDAAVVLAAVKEDPCNLQFADSSILRSRRLMTQALETNFNSVYYVDKELMRDRLFLTQVVNADGMFLKSRLVPTEMKSEPEVIMTAVQQNGHALQFANPDMQASREIVEIAVRNNGTSIAYASPELRADFDMVMLATRQNRMAVVHALGGLRNNPDIRAAAGQSTSPKYRKGNLHRETSVSFSERIKEKFYELDEDHDGFLSYGELYELLKRGSADMAEEDVRVLFDALDTEKDGRIDFYEFCDFIHDGGVA
mmetsp:Transcript_130214/g.236628  ORF Transcript_130214/g.236628 Transcript_130214/m.236628 type:complete len:375 (+) Transcript_130214:69-1193(+)